MLTNNAAIRKNTISALLVLTMIFFLFAAVSAVSHEKAYATGETAKVTADALNVRTGAGTGYKCIGTMLKGKTFTVKGTASDKNGVKWYKLTYNNKTGYVISKYVNIIKFTVTSVSNTKGTVSDGPLNVRTGPGTSYTRLGSMAKGKTFTVTGKTNDINGKLWYRLTYNGKTGYVRALYVKTTEVTSGFSVTEVKNTKVTVTCSSLNVRTGPGTNYTRLGSLSKGKTFTISGKARDKNGTWWYRFTYNSKTGYVHSGYVKTSGTSSSSGTASSSSTVTFKTGTVTTSDGLNVRTGAGTGYSKLTVLAKGTTVVITGSAKDSNGKTWYIYKYSTSQKGYICSDYVTVKTVKSDSEFEDYLTAQGFPESYKPGLRALHAEHPNWVFKAYKAGYSWRSAVSYQKSRGGNLISGIYPSSYRDPDDKYTQPEPGWYKASKTVIAHYMDPRNFLNETGIYQFMTHKFDSSSQSKSTVKSVIAGSFMEGVNPPGDYSSYQSLIYAAGKASNVNPNVLAAMIIQEQGWSGSKMVTGTVSGYRGYYNFFNIGAYPTSTMTAVQRGLWYASCSGSYSRPWNSPYKSIKGGAQFYAQSYVNCGQDSYYTKKFNVKNGISNVGRHQYMTNVSGAASEGGIVKRGYSSSAKITFEIPVYNSMPASACPLP